MVSDFTIKDQSEISGDSASRTLEAAYKQLDRSRLHTPRPVEHTARIPCINNVMRLVDSMAPHPL